MNHKDCPHTTVKCLCCGKEATPAQFMGKAKKNMTPEAIAARKANGAKGGRPKKEKAP